MKTLIITESYLPHLGGVEKHIAAILPYLKKAGLEVKIINKKELLKNQKEIKYFTLLKIWYLIFKKRSLIKEAEIVFIHDVFIYYLPFKLLFPKKKVICTFHGFEKSYPIPPKNIFYKKLAQKLSAQTISIGQYINKYYFLKEKNNHISYGGVELPKKEIKLKDKDRNSFLFVGRLEKDTGLSIFIDFLDILIAKKINFSVKFCGAGPLEKQCQKYGQTLGAVEVHQYLKKSESCFAGGYLSILEAMAYKNFPLAAYNNPLKKDYLLGSPFASSIACADNGQDLYQKFLSLKKQKDILEKNNELAKNHSFAKLAKLYIELSKYK